MLAGRLLTLLASSTSSGKTNFLASIKRMESNPPSTERLLLLLAPCSVVVDDDEVSCSCSDRVSREQARQGQGGSVKAELDKTSCSSLDLLLPRIQLELILWWK